MNQLSISLPKLGQKLCDHPSTPTTPCSSCDTPEKTPIGPLSRVWEPPPRPKPGRKPATDNPTNKRKAQNRQAQRNFRERRAQKINELEDVMREKEQGYTTNIDSLRTEVANLQNQLAAYRERCSYVEEQLRDERIARAAVEAQLSKAQHLLQEHRGVVLLHPRLPSPPDVGSPIEERSSTPTRPLSSTLPALTAAVSAAAAAAAAANAASAPATCGSNCGPQDCACLESIIDADKTNDDTSSVTPTATGATASRNSPSLAHTRASSPGAHDAMEIDMTLHGKKTASASFAAGEIQRGRSPSRDMDGALNNSGPKIDDCGFCANSSFCPCRDAARESLDQDPSAMDVTSRFSQSQQPPQPSGQTSSVQLPRGGMKKVGAGDVTGADASSGNSGCTGQPGSCKQCQYDPMSKDFCVSFANSVSPSAGSPKGGPSSSRGGPQSRSGSKSGATAGCGVADCCQNRQQQPAFSHMRQSSRPQEQSHTTTLPPPTASSSSHSISAQAPSSQGLPHTATLGGNAGGSSVDCATAYNRLKLHPHFDKAMAEKDAWLGKLLPVPVPSGPRAGSLASFSGPGSGLGSGSNGGSGGGSGGGIAAHSGSGGSGSLEGRSAYEIDAASIMATFKHFDMRFGAETRNDWKGDK